MSGTPSVSEPSPWGLLIAVGTLRQHGRYVMLEAREPIVRDLATRAQVPKLWIKAFAEPDLMRSWLTPDWTDDGPGSLMAVDLAGEPVRVPDGYSVGTEARGSVVFVTVSAADGSVAATANLGGTADGRALYETLGWKAYAPLNSFVYRP